MRSQLDLLEGTLLEIAAEMTRLKKSFFLLNERNSALKHVVSSFREILLERGLINQAELEEMIENSQIDESTQNIHIEMQSLEEEPIN